MQVETSSGTEYVWTGDRWMQAPDGQKGHEPQFWAVLRFDEEGNVLPIEWVDEMTLVRRNALGSAEESSFRSG